MSTPFRQESFAGGELSPRLRGRTALAKYFIGLRRAHNFFIALEGAAMNRPGTRFVRETKDSAVGVDRPVRLIPFVFSEDLNQSYVLEFGHQYIRFHTNGGTVAAPASGSLPAYAGGTTYARGTWVASGGVSYISLQDGNTGHTPVSSPTWWEALSVYEVATPYAAADVARLKFAQVGDLLNLTHPGYDPRELQRRGHQDWVLLPVMSFDRPAPTSNPALLDYLPEADSTHPEKEWSWIVTELRRSNGESGPKRIDTWWLTYYLEWKPAPFQYPVDYRVKWTPAGHNYRNKTGNNGVLAPNVDATNWEVDDVEQNPPPAVQMTMPSVFVLYPDKKITLYLYSTYGLRLDDPDFITYRLYRGRGGEWGWIGDTELATFTDEGQVPDLTRSPPQGVNPFKVFDAEGDLVRTERPSCVTFFEQRRAFFNLAVGATPYRPATALFSRTGDYDNFDVNVVKTDDDSLELELASRRREEIRWAVGLDRLLIGTQSSVWAGGGAGSPLSPYSMDFRVQGEIGSSWLDPIIIPPDIVLFVRTKGTGVRDLVFELARGKFVGSDLSLLSRHLFTGFSIVDWAYQEDPWSIVWAVRSDGKFLSLSYLREQEVWAWTWHDTQGTVEDVCSIPEVDEDAVYLLVKRQKGDGTWHRYVERMASRVTPLDENDVPDPKEGLFLDSAVTARDLADDDETHTSLAITGLDHLEGLQVVALADSAVVREDEDGNPLTVQGGQVSIPDLDGTGFAVVHVGLAYEAEVELLDLAMQGRDLRTNVKKVQKVAFEVEDSRGLEVAESVDSPEEDWVEWEQRDVADSYGPMALYSGLAEVTTFSTWNKKGRAALRQRDPLPCTILAATREAEIGGS